ncbi:hypothetical protein N8837_01060 [Pseudomonadales bacterium]|nr:hypothetical protein [Pseudomonadales bacterium]
MPEVVYLGQKRIKDKIRPQKQLKDSNDKFILICFNARFELDSLESIMELIEAKIPNHKVKIRLHKYINKEEARARFPDFNISTILDETLAESFSNAEWCIAGNSSILLDALVAGVTPLYFRTNEHHDYYGFVEVGLISELLSDTDINHVISISNQERLKLYYG